MDCNRPPRCNCILAAIPEGAPGTWLFTAVELTSSEILGGVKVVFSEYASTGSERIGSNRPPAGYGLFSAAIYF